MHKYKSLAPAGGYGFTPLIIETSGTLGRSLEKFSKEILKKQQIPKKFQKQLRYWISALSDITKYL